MNSNLAKAFVLAVAFQAASAMANSPDVLICPDEGCSIITCNDETCTVWNCSGGQCSDVGNFPNPNPGGSGDGASGSSSPGVTAADRDSTNAGLTRSQDAVPLFGPVGGLDCGSSVAPSKPVMNSSARCWDSIPEALSCWDDSIMKTS